MDMVQKVEKLHVRFFFLLLKIVSGQTPLQRTLRLKIIIPGGQNDSHPGSLQRRSGTHRDLLGLVQTVERLQQPAGTTLVLVVVGK